MSRMSEKDDMDARPSPPSRRRDVRPRTMTQKGSEYNQEVRERELRRCHKRWTKKTQEIEALLQTSTGPRVMKDQYNVLIELFKEI